MSSFAPSISSPEDAPQDDPCRPPSVGPLWMAAGVCLLFVSYAALGIVRRSTALLPDYSHHAIIYSSQILGEWLLLGATLATVYHRRSFLRESLLNGARAWTTEFAHGFVLFVTFTAAAAVVRGLIHFFSRSLVGANAPDHLIRSADRGLGVSHHVLLQLTPATGLDLLLWTLVSISAAVCEELIFRGYLLRQCIAALRKLSLSHKTSGVLAVVLTGALFGSVHVYEGVASAVTVGCLGAFYAALALRLRNLRAVVAAQFLQDFLVGLVSYLNHFFLPR